jgi:anti-anti-sigma regulatory factor
MYLDQEQSVLGSTRLESSPRFRVEQFHGVTVITLLTAKMFNRLTNYDFDCDLLHFVQRHHPQHLVISFEQVQMFSTEVIATLVRAKRELAKHGGILSLCCLNDFHREVFQTIDPRSVLFPRHQAASDAWTVSRN